MYHTQDGCWSVIHSVDRPRLGSIVVNLYSPVLFKTAKIPPASKELTVETRRLFCVVHGYECSSGDSLPASHLKLAGPRNIHHFLFIEPRVERSHSFAELRSLLIHNVFNIDLLPRRLIYTGNWTLDFTLLIKSILRHSLCTFSMY